MSTCDALGEERRVFERAGGIPESLGARPALPAYSGIPAETNLHLHLTDYRTEVLTLTFINAGCVMRRKGSGMEPERDL